MFSRKEFKAYLESLVVNSFTGRETEVASGIFKGNCTALAKVFLPDLPGELAFEIFENLKEHPQVEVSHLCPGDLIVWRKTNLSKKGSTGHLAFVDEVLNLDDKKVSLRVFDCVKKPHRNDSRVNGVGFGEIDLVLDKGRAIGFIWGGEISKTKLTPVLLLRSTNLVQDIGSIEF